MGDIKQRSIIDYDRKTKISITRKLHILSLQIEDKSDDGINTIWPNQDECGEIICKVFSNKLIVNCLVYGQTQTGKTGCMTSLIQHFCLSNLIPIDNIYIITGLSDKEWKKDTKNRMPDTINTRVFHRANLTRVFLKEILEKKNLLIIMDEIQIACEEKQTIHKTFKECGFYNLDLLLQNDIKLIQFSATPDGHINDISDWQNHSAKVKLEPGSGYYGVIQATEQCRVKEYKCLTEPSHVNELKKDIEGNYSNPRYHLIRVPNKRGSKQELVISNFQDEFGDEYEYNYSYLETKKNDINKLLKNKPDKHTFVFYCEILRCAKTQYKEFIGISYERYVKSPNDSSVIQGSFGRLTGYDDNGDSICYTHIPSLKNYIKLWDNNMEFKKGIQWNTNTTQYNQLDDITYSTGTFNSVKNIDQLKDGCSEKVKVVFDVKYEIIEDWVGLTERTKALGYTNVRKPSKKDNDGFYKTSLNRKAEKISLNQAIEAKDSSYGYNKNKEKAWRTYIPCYIDVNDINTLVYLLIIKPIKYD
jgi:hypothetical protein